MLSRGYLNRELPGVRNMSGSGKTPSTTKPPSLAINQNASPASSCRNDAVKSGRREDVVAVCRDGSRVCSSVVQRSHDCPDFVCCQCTSLHHLKQPTSTRLSCSRELVSFCCLRWVCSSPLKALCRTSWPQPCRRHLEYTFRRHLYLL